MASAEARERRRINRRLAAIIRAEQRRRQQHHDQRHRQELDQAIVLRRRWIPPESRHPLHADRRYWQARSCGWDALSAELARDASGLPCEPHQSVFWAWWTGLHYESRNVLIALSAEIAAPRMRPSRRESAWTMHELVRELRRRFAPFHADESD